MKMKMIFNIAGVKRQDDESDLLERRFRSVFADPVKVRDDIDLASVRSFGAAPESIELEQDDLVSITFDDDIELMTTAGQFREDFLGHSRAGAAGNTFELTRQLPPPPGSAASRGVFTFILKRFRVIDVGAKFAARAVARKIESKLLGEHNALYSIKELKSVEMVGESNIRPVSSDTISTEHPVLIFVHGTASSTSGSFSDLWATAKDDGVWTDLTAAYGKNILGFEHRTLSQSPIENAIDLANGLPQGATVHLVSHSRGGLVGELLCRGQMEGSTVPFTESDFALFDPAQNRTLSDTLKRMKELLGSDVEIKKDYAVQRKALKKLNEVLLSKQIQVERFVRVACPARGTTLTSERLDRYLSGVLNIIGHIPMLKASPVYAALEALLLAIAKQRTLPQELPGFEAQMPDSPLIAVLNGSVAQSVSQLSVIAGDAEAEGIFKKIALYLVDRFYDSDHDLVVNTPSMDGGTPRSMPVRLMPVKGAHVNHFKYFHNPDTRKALLDELTSGDATQFEPTERREVYIARSLPRGRQRGEVPAVFILPGISGSHLGIDDDRIWLSIPAIFRGRFTKLHADSQDVEAQKMFGSAYGRLSRYLGGTHEVIPFPYDWRLSVFDAADALAVEVDRYLNESEQPVRFVAHSMGGLVMRAMMVQHRDLWRRIARRDGSRVLMLGTPNGGSVSIARMLANQESLIRYLAAVDIRHDAFELLDVLRGLPGVLGLLPAPDDNPAPGQADFYNSGAGSLWRQFRDVLGNEWHLPTQADLNRARKDWQRLHSSRLDPQRVFYVAGIADETPVDAEVTDDEIVFISTTRGDGRVPWNTGIPDGIKHWYVDAVHGDLADYKEAFKGFLEIIERGDTRLLSQQAPASRAIDSRSVLPPDHVDMYPDEAALTRAALGGGSQRRDRRGKAMPAVSVSVVHGDICSASGPVMVGHYAQDEIASAEGALDRLLNGRLKELDRLGLYPSQLGTHSVVTGIKAGERIGAIVTGLGDIGTLTPGRLTSTVRDAALRYVLDATEGNWFGNGPIKLCSLLVGSGSFGVSLEVSLSAIIRGVLEANELLLGDSLNTDRTITAIEFFELYEHRAHTTQYLLSQLQSVAEFDGSYRFCFDLAPDLGQAEGGQRSIIYLDDNDWWQRLLITRQPDRSLKFTISSESARVDMRVSNVERRSMDAFIDSATRSTTSSDRIGRVLFERLIPTELKMSARDNRNLVLVVDKSSARYPWELLEYEGRNGDIPIAVYAGVVRQLATTNQQPGRLCTNRRALVIGDPDTGGFAPHLPGAASEAKSVYTRLKADFDPEVTLLLNADSHSILVELLASSYQILHIAAHGVVDMKLPAKDGYDDKLLTGVVIGYEQILTSDDIRAMPRTPELVVINCCYVGRIDDAHGELLGRRDHLAANLGVQLIEQGVKAVIVAGWAVDDAAAATFANAFYDRMLGGKTFGDAVKEARKRTYNEHPGMNTWGAYQCYGSPRFQLSIGKKNDARENIRYTVSPTACALEINNIAERARTAAETGYLIAQLDAIEKNIRPDWLDPANRGAAGVLAAFGKARAELDQLEQAIDCYELVSRSEHADLSITAVEQLANFQALRALRLACDASSRPQARALIESAEDLLETLVKQFGPTVERLCLQGSTAKKRAEVFTGNAQKTALKRMRDDYHKAYRLRFDQTGQTYAYPLLNWLTARTILVYRAWVKDNLKDANALIAMVRPDLADGDLNREHFWQAIQKVDCDLLQALIAHELPGKQSEITQQYLDIRAVAVSFRQFRSVIEHLKFLHAMLLPTKSMSASRSNTLKLARNALGEMIDAF
jgi:CHAT domain-containing protein/pimeloyl-ACP methyl ester carboxylesterase